jgi:2-(1,2-epoxy-1,2-dihydrophenyl)acetyl-CoA isomerase
MGLALLGDISVMARSAYLLLAFVNIGLVPDAGATWLVAKGVGRTKALEMALLGERLTAEDAQTAGLITRVVDDEAVQAEALAIARKLASGPSLAIGMIRKQVATALNQTLEESLETERSNQSRAGKTRDFKEAVAAFAEKRQPRFEGY